MRGSTPSSEKLVKESGGDYVKNPLAGSVMGHQPATAHPLGGCGMGRDRCERRRQSQVPVFVGLGGRGATAVHEGLYVIDGSVIPRSLGVNPLLTITALSERAMILFAEEHGLRFDTQVRAGAPIPATSRGLRRWLRKPVSGKPVATFAEAL